MKFYIASKLENAPRVRELKLILEEKGWEHTYDWTVHGSVQKDGHERIAKVASAEAEDVWSADVVIVLLPGGRGTHVELGIAIGLVDAVVWSAHEQPRPLIFVCSPSPEEDFGDNGTTCAFYHHPCVTMCGGTEDLLTKLEAVRGE